MTRRVLVTGAGGFVGRSLVASLAAKGWRVRAASRNTGLSWPDGVESVQAPDLAGTSPDRAMAELRSLTDGMTDVVHLAGIAHQTRTISADTYMAVNGAACGALATAARDAGVQRIVLMSSIRAQSGPVSGHCLSEADAPAPTDAYGHSKLAGERALAAALAGSKTEHVILRPVVIYGPHAKGNMAALARLARSPLPAPFANLPAQRSILAMANLVNAVQHALIEPGVAGETCIVADPEPLTLAEMMAALRAGLGRRAGLVPLDVGLISKLTSMISRGEALNRLTGGLAVDVTRLRRSGWRPEFGSEVGLYRWMRGE